MEIYIDNRQKKIKINNDINDIIEDVVKETLTLENMELDYEVSISFVNNDEIRELNKEYRGIDKVTDVLSFPMDDEFMVEGPNLLGDIIISAEVAEEQAREYGHSLYREIVYLVTHSMFHLIGYDHIDPDEKIIMREREKELLKKLKVFKDSRGD